MLKRKTNFFKEVEKDIKTWFHLVFVSEISRIYFIYSIKKYIAYFSFCELCKVLLAGLKYDVYTASFICVILTLFISIPKHFSFFRSKIDTIRCIMSFFFVTIIILLNTLQIEFFKEFKSTFNETFFEFYFDDTKAIFSTILKDSSLLNHIFFHGERFLH